MAKVLAPSGVFVFNTFNRKPDRKPMVKEYELDGKKFVEVSWLVGNLVYHLQIREGMKFHATAFTWLSETRLVRLLRPHFKVRVIKDGPTSLYRCELRR